MGKKAAQLGGKGEIVSQPAIVKWLFPHAVARKVQYALVPVPGRQREHPTSRAQGVARSVRSEKGKQNLRIGMAAKCIPCILELSAQRKKIIDLTVENNGPASIRTTHRLAAERA